MNQQQLEQAIGIEGDPPFDEYVQQVLDTFQEEAEAYESIPMDHVTTPEPCDAPQTTLAGIVNCIRYAAMGDIRMTRVSNGYIAVVAMLRVARWVPQYRRIAQERDHLLEQREELRTERAKLLRERAAAWKENQVLKAALGVEIAEPPAARTVTSSPPHRTSTPIDQITEQTHAIPEPQVPEPGADEPREMATVTRGSPVASTSRARSVTPNSSARRSPTQPISPFREPAMALRNATRKGGRMPLPPSSSSASEEERPGVPNHGGGPEVEVGVCPESPRTVPKLILKRFKSSAAKQHKTHKKIRCPICKKHCSQLVAFRCYACKEFWERQKRAFKQGAQLATCNGDHKGEQRPDLCAGCRRRAYEVALQQTYPTIPLPIPSIFKESAGFRNAGECEPQLTDAIPPVSESI
ncbi:hypothetical protein GE061_004086 [Apolygus lucorum]|uniref:Uncharacterized protein n=1 Tax=Apolygus lucorum TaxID=248454 RepID=A0A8S9X021_APOLU|nr:hypothetical protein GE061_004086 [Apolygus lucorum]